LAVVFDMMAFDARPAQEFQGGARVSVMLTCREVEAGVARVHPHELVGACTLSPLPVDFTRASAAAAQVVEKLDAAIGR